MPRFIPTRVFQLLAVLLLVPCWGLPFYWSYTHTGLVRVLDGWASQIASSSEWDGFVAFLLSFLICSVLWLVLVFPLRAFSQLPTLSEELQGKSWQEIYAIEQAKNEALHQRPFAEYTPEMRYRARWLGGVYVLLGVLMGLFTGWTAVISLREGSLYVFQIALLITAPILIVIGFVQLVTGRSIIRK